MPDSTKINGDFFGKDILSIDQFSPSDIELLFSSVPKFQQIAQTTSPNNTLSGKVITLLFYEPSSRTFGSFFSAAQRLGAGVLSIQNPETVSSVAKGETLEDTIRTFASYSEAIVMRSKEKGAALKASLATDIPIINAGDGTGEHPTQALLDMYTIYEKFHKLSGITGVMVGDLLNGRTVHSLLKALALFPNNHMYLLSPASLQLPQDLSEILIAKGLKLTPITSSGEMPKDASFWYWTRVQKERFADLAEYERTKHAFVLTPKLLDERGNKDLILMHPLPRVGEIEEAVDSDPRAYYFKQMKNGLYVRMTLFDLILNRKK